MIAHDIGARLREKEKFRLAVEAMPNGVLMIDGDGHVTLVNMQTAKLFGYEKAELVGQDWAALLPKRCRDELAGNTKTVFANPIFGPVAMGADLYGRRKNGSEFPIEMSLHPIQTADGLMVIGVVVDISERARALETLREFNIKLERKVARRTAELTQANRDLEEFAYAASHDLKAPLRVIENASKWLEEDLQPHLTVDTRASMNLLRGRVRRMERLLDDLLEYSRAGLDSDSQHTEMVRGSALVDDIMKLLSPSPFFEVRVCKNFSDILVERMPLQQVLMNLIGNAIKHHDRKAGYIEVNVDVTDRVYAFAVKDDGPGIDPQFHEQIFKMFQTLKPKDQLEGGGMGLALVRKRVEMRGGKIHLASTSGRGSVFAFTWPKVDARTEHAA